VFCDDPGQPSTFGTPSPRLNTWCSARELYLLCSGLQKSVGAEVARGGPFNAAWRAALGRKRDIAPSMPPYVCLRQGRRRPTPRFHAAGASGITALRHASVAPRSFGQRLELAEGISPRGLICHCSDKTGNIYSASLHICRFVLRLPHACPRQGRRRPTPRCFAADAGGVTWLKHTSAPQRSFGQRLKLADGAQPGGLNRHCEV
jgi:hypothetical protein